MAAKRKAVKKVAKKVAKKAGPLMGGPVAERLADALAALERSGTAHTLNGMSRYGITAKKAFGVAVGDIQRVAKRYGRDHELALALWGTEWYEARMLCAWVDDPDQVTPAQMGAWAADFDSWAICDTIIMHNWDRTPHAWPMALKWMKAKPEFVRRAGFAMLASMALHHKQASDAPFQKALAEIERAATDERNFVKKAVNWALRGIALRSPALRRSGIALAKKLAARDEPSARWIGKDALRQLEKRG